MKRLRNPIFWFGFAEAILYTVGGGAILEKNSPIIALVLIALARGAAYGKTFFEGEKKQSNVQ